MSKNKLFVGYYGDLVAGQAVQILHERGYNAFMLEEGVPLPDGAVLIFSTTGQFASKFIATVPEDFERRGFVPPPCATKETELLPIRRTHDGSPYGCKRAPNLAAALENYVGYKKHKPPREKVNRRELSLQRKRESRADYFG